MRVSLYTRPAPSETVSDYHRFGDCLHFIGQGRKFHNLVRRKLPPTAGEMTMRVFVTGSTGFIGTELVKELIAAGHQVRGLTRSDAGVEQLKAVSAEVHRGDLTDLEILHKGATGMDAVVNLAFSYDWSTFAQNARDEIQAIETLGSTLEPGKLLVVT